MDNETANHEIRARLAANDPSALDMIWNHYVTDLLGYLVSLMCSRHDAEDVLQDVFWLHPVLRLAAGLTAAFVRAW